LTISGKQIITELPYIGLVPGSIGVYQVNFRLPDHLPSGNIELHLERTQDCGFFFQLRCGRGPTITPTLKVKLPTAG
jgi:hypothetical protein